tara:strand:- start:5220 stop:5633 length:414 start_codon:yes stop_codon:yes gene_type:complete
MGFTLVTAESQEEFNINFFEWRPLLLLGEAYGWNPAGTLMDVDESWDGSYLSNDGQKITEEDSEKLAKAIEVAYEDVPAEQITDFFKHFGETDDGYEDYYDALHNKDHNTLMMHFSGNKTFLSKFIIFLKKGEIFIH